MLRTGSVPYLVGRPLDAGLEQIAGLELERRVPAELVHQLREERLDVALVSAIELFRQPGARPLEGLAVAGRGRVDSVQVFLRKPIEGVRRLAMDPASRAAASLVKVLLADRAEGPPEYVEVPLGVDPRQADADAWLRIGDRALEEAWLEGLPCWNPSEEWTRSTGLPFVFATWLVRGATDLGTYRESFWQAAEAGTLRIPEFACTGAQDLGLPEDRLLHYLSEQCWYLPGERMHAALVEYGQHVRRLGLGERATPKPLPRVLHEESRCRG